MTFDKFKHLPQRIQDTVPFRVQTSRACLFDLLKDDCSTEVEFKLLTLVGEMLQTDPS